MTSRKLVLSLLGPPGSGKGSYGRHFAKALQCSLIGMSDVLREICPHLNLSSGALVDDNVVTQSLSDYLQNHHNDTTTQGYVLDGYPRTIRQLETGLVTVDAAIQLAVPDIVCETKLQGRRLCRTCGGNFNVNGVDWQGWVLPPTLPRECSLPCDWVTRPDDTPKVVHSRLQLYHQHMDPIIQYFEQHDQLLKLTPYRGFEDLTVMTTQVQTFLKERRLHTI